MDPAELTLETSPRPIYFPPTTFYTFQDLLDDKCLELLSEDERREAALHLLRVSGVKVPE